MIIVILEIGEMDIQVIKMQEMNFRVLQHLDLGVWICVRPSRVQGDALWTMSRQFRAVPSPTAPDTQFKLQFQTSEALYRL